MEYRLAELQVMNIEFLVYPAVDVLDFPFMKSLKNINLMKIRLLWLIFCCSAITAVSGCTITPAKAGSSIEARQRFNLHCVTAGEKITRTADNVDGLFVMKLRSEKSNYGDQYLLDDPYGRDLGGEGYLKSFLREYQLLKRSNISVQQGPPKSPSVVGYYYVEALDLKDSERYRYTVHIDEPWLNNKHYLKGYLRSVLDRVPAAGPLPKYGVTYQDISTVEDRKFWIAGSSLKVVDLETNEVIAERIGYMFDPGQGSTADGRSPWLIAANYACPAFGDRHAFSFQAEQTVKFVEKVLHPTLGK